MNVGDAPNGWRPDGWKARFVEDLGIVMYGTGDFR